MNLISEIREGTIWRERDAHGCRFVKVLYLARPGAVRVRTCDEIGEPVFNGKSSEMSQENFVKRFMLLGRDRK